MTIRTWHDLIRRYIPDADDKRCEFILWEKTAFPLVPVETIKGSCKNMLRRYRNDECTNC